MTIAENIAGAIARTIAFTIALSAVYFLACGVFVR